MKTLISAFALLAFVGASTVPLVTAQAQGSQNPTTTNSGNDSTMSAPAPAKKAATKKASAKKATAKKASAKKTASAKKKTAPSASPAAPKTM